MEICVDERGSRVSTLGDDSDAMTLALTKKATSEGTVTLHPWDVRLPRVFGWTNDGAPIGGVAKPHMS
jgi:hypothetical protein